MRTNNFWWLVADVQIVFKFTVDDAVMVTEHIYDECEWVNYDDLKLQVFRFAQRLKNGGC